MLAQKEYKRRHDNIARLVHRKLCCKYDVSRGEKWYEHQPEGVVENEKCKILWDMTIQCDHVIEARRPDNLLVQKENNKAIIVDIQCRSKGNISGGGARKCWRREPLGGSGGMLPQKNLKSRDLEMLFPAFSKSYL